MKTIRAWLIGFADGWHNPQDMSMSRNVDHLGNDAANAHDFGANWGQLLRSPRHHQYSRHEVRYW